MTPTSSRPTAQILVGAIVALTGLGLAGGALKIPGEAGYGGVGPNFLPWGVAFVLTACGVLILREAFTGGFRQMEEPSGGERAWWPGLVWVSAGPAAHTGPLTPNRFVPRCALWFGV